jgi:hypothetical protein
MRGQALAGLKENSLQGGLFRLQCATNTDKLLREELQRLKTVLNTGHELTSKYRPSTNAKLCGEVKGKCLYIYDEDQNSALATLRHEFLDYSISEAIEPYKKVANKLIELLNEEAYARKEKLVEVLVNAIQASACASHK